MQISVASPNTSAKSINSLEYLGVAALVIVIIPPTANPQGPEINPANAPNIAPPPEASVSFGDKSFLTYLLMYFISESAWFFVNV